MTNTVMQVVTQLLMICGILALTVSLFAEFFVKKLWNLNTAKLNKVISIVSMILTLIAGITYMTISNLHIYWYHIIGFILGGFLTAIISMNGYDKVLSYIYSWLKNMGQDKE